jgi:Protein of unknown function (DUF3761)
MVTQRTANPSIPVRFRARPPTISIGYLLIAKWLKISVSILSVLPIMRVALIALASFTIATSAFASESKCHETPGYYTNSAGESVHRPECVPEHQEGETAICNDGSHSFSHHRTGTCSHHRGVSKWE